MEEIIESAGALSDDERLELAQRLIEQATRHEQRPLGVDVNALAGKLKLDEDPLAIQERLRHKWQFATF